MNASTGSPRAELTGRLRCLAVALASFPLLLPSAIAAADVRAGIDRSAISLTETLQLVLESEGPPDSPPDLSVLAPNFEILDRRTSREVSIVNGQRSERKVLILRLRPRRAGALTIPPISFGDSATEALQLSVEPSATGPAEPTAAIPAVPGDDRPTSSPMLVLEADLDPDRGYIGQQLLLTARVLMDGPVQGARLQDPQVPAARVLPLGEDRYESERDGKRYWVYERRYAIFPRDAGRLEIDPLRFQGWVAGGSATGTGVGYGSPGQQVHASSGALSAEVLPAPERARKYGWLPARDLRLSESGPETYRAQPGEPIERRISLRADGVMAEDLPAPTLPVPYQIVSQRGQPRLWDERTPRGVIGHREEVAVLRSREPGHFRLPPVTLAWWNTDAGRRESAVLPARGLVVSAGGRTDSGVTPPETAAPATDPLVRDPLSLPSEGTAAGDAASDAAREEAAAKGSPWIWITVALALGWIATMAAWWHSRRRAVPTAPDPVLVQSPPAIETTEPLQREIEAVRAAYQAGNAADAREALLAWAVEALPEQTPSNLARLARRCPQPLRDQILLLEEDFFSPLPVAWDKQPVWEGLLGFVPEPPEEPASFRRGKPIRRRAANPDAE